MSQVPCDSDGCPEPAQYAISFRSQVGHVHDCERHTAALQLLADVKNVVPMPCPWPDLHTRTWIATPKELA